MLLIRVGFVDHVKKRLSGYAFVEFVKHADEGFHTLNLLMTSKVSHNFVDFYQTVYGYEGIENRFGSGGG